MLWDEEFFCEVWMRKRKKETKKEKDGVCLLLEKRMKERSLVPVVI